MEGKRLEKSKYGKYIVSKPYFDPNLANINTDVPRDQIRGRTSNNIFMSNDLVKGSNTHLNLMWIYEVPYPDPFTATHSHDFNEVLFLSGSNPHDLEDLGGALDIEIGDEMHTITASTAIYLPKGLPHNIHWKKVERPIMLLAITLYGEYS